MNELGQLKMLSESLQLLENYGESRIMYVFDNGHITELDTQDDVAYARFNRIYGFDSNSIFDFPVEHGCRTFQTRNRTVIVSDDPQALAAEVEAQTQDI